LPDAIKVDLKPQTVQAFDRYVHTAEERMDQQLGSSQFLWVDGTPVLKLHARQGQIVSQPWDGASERKVPDGLIHDWIGVVFIPGANLNKTLELVEDYNNHKNIYKPEVIDSRIIAREDGHFRVGLRLLKKQVITVVLSTEHDVHYFPSGLTRCYSRSYSTRIAEVERPAMAEEKEMPVGHDHGFLWRLNSYWRFEEKDGGVYVECEAISLTRDVPTGLGWLINPIIHNLPRESLANTLRLTREAVARR
jgi:hypothetical protein